MGKVARRFAGLVVVVGVGCSFDTLGSSDSNQLGSSVGSDATASAGGDTETDDTTEGDGDGEGSTSFVGGSTSVGNDEECVDTCAPGVPEGWSGPFYIVDATTPVECPTGFARQDLGFRGLSALPPTCACNCLPEGGNCSIGFELSITSTCFGPLVTGSLQDETCIAYGAAGQDVRMLAQLAGSPVSCAPDVSMNVAEATWESASTFCAAPARGGDCGADECIAQSPEGYSTQLCVSGDGDVDCPAGDWDTRTVVYRSFEDQRACDGCTCSGPSACEAQASAYDNGGCGGTPQPVGFNDCTDISVSGSYWVGAAIDNGTCEASTVTAAGQAIPSDAVTLCCAS